MFGIVLPSLGERQKKKNNEVEDNQ